MLCEAFYFVIFVLIVVDEISGRVAKRIKYLFQVFTRYVGFDELFRLFCIGFNRSFIFFLKNIIFLIVINIRQKYRCIIQLFDQLE